ncbi:MAG: uncharacterized protein A8A55_1267 [Amphiamblys sp. WSBS2006]|nr:MAG: uncharacterized protein A8A55_1267 [Amphiamblys sp. WSBS2006]
MFFLLFLSVFQCSVQNTGQPRQVEYIREVDTMGPQKEPDSSRVQEKGKTENVLKAIDIMKMILQNKPTENVQKRDIQYIKSGDQTSPQKGPQNKEMYPEVGPKQVEPENTRNAQPSSPENKKESPSLEQATGGITPTGNGPEKTPMGVSSPQTKGSCGIVPVLNSQQGKQIPSQEEKRPLKSSVGEEQSSAPVQMQQRQNSQALDNRLRSPGDSKKTEDKPQKEPTGEDKYIEESKEDPEETARASFPLLKHDQQEHSPVQEKLQEQVQKQQHEPVQERPREPVQQQPREQAPQQPHEPVQENPHEPVQRQPHEPIQQQPRGQASPAQNQQQPGNREEGKNVPREVEDLERIPEDRKEEEFNRMWKETPEEEEEKMQKLGTLEKEKIFPARLLDVFRKEVFNFTPNRGKLRLVSRFYGQPQGGAKEDSKDPQAKELILNGKDVVFFNDSLLVLAGGEGEGPEAGKFSATLAELVKRGLGVLDIFHLSQHSKRVHLLLKREICRAFGNRPQKGAATTLFASLLLDSRLAVTSVGDSILFVFRGGKIAAHTRQMICSDCVPEHISSRRCGKETHYSFPVQKGDLIVACTNGITDNLYPGEIEKIISANMQDVDDMAEKLVEAALLKTTSERVATPYGDRQWRKFKKELPKAFTGPKEIIQAMEKQVAGKGNSEKTKDVLKQLQDNFKVLHSASEDRMNQFREIEPRIYTGKPDDMSVVVSVIV